MYHLFFILCYLVGQIASSLSPIDAKKQQQQKEI